MKKLSKASGKKAAEPAIYLDSVFEREGIDITKHKTITGIFVDDDKYAPPVIGFCSNRRKFKMDDIIEHPLDPKIKYRVEAVETLTEEEEAKQGRPYTIKDIVYSYKMVDAYSLVDALDTAIKANQCALSDHFSIIFLE